MALLLSSISQGLLWAIMAIGVYLTFRILNVADLTAEGSFPLGAAVSTSLIVTGVAPWLSVLIALLGGMAAGLISGLLYTKWKIPALLSGIITMTGLYSINLRIMGQANISLLGEGTLIRTVESFGLNKTNAVLLVGSIAVGLVILALHMFFHTEVGLAIRSTGDNNEMSEANGIRTNVMKVIGYMLSNGLIAMSGALLAQNNGYADISMGIGTIVIGLASIIIGEVFFRNLSIAKRLMTVVLGSVIYRLLILIVLQMNVNPQDLKVFSAILLALALRLPAVQNRLSKPKSKVKSTKMINKKGGALSWLQR
ncbi:putative ABC transport system permease protein [Alkalibacterium subtropicum]|uniref:Putative ABC transport system permease protein n=1 Tax=Alkalibacterium subtropicum TaxID=753702 RepID=A0A1I1KGZ3_9LACT|nr:ABC transporter permease [Alkalibacterium subtropicum]SFC59542.1 putative ABC transport system permease protein [Alkalibacterium subtropicum]